MGGGVRFEVVVAAVWEEVVEECVVCRSKPMVWDMWSCFVFAKRGIVGEIG